MDPNSETHTGLASRYAQAIIKVSRWLDGVKPYSSHVQIEQERLKTLVKECEEAMYEAHGYS